MVDANEADDLNAILLQISRLDTDFIGERLGGRQEKVIRLIQNFKVLAELVAEESESLTRQQAAEIAHTFRTILDILRPLIATHEPVRESEVHRTLIEHWRTLMELVVKSGLVAPGKVVSESEAQTKSVKLQDLRHPRRRQSSDKTRAPPDEAVAALLRRADVASEEAAASRARSAEAHEMVKRVEAQLTAEKEERLRLEAQLAKLTERSARLESAQSAINLDQVQTALAETREAAKEAKLVAEAARKAAGEVAVARYASFFAKETALHEEQADSWLWWTIGTAIATLILALLLFALPTFSWFPELTDIQLIEFAVFRVLVITTLAGFVYWFSQQYRTNRHNAVVNRHRQHAVNTFEVFYRRSTDEEARRAVLMETTRAVFGHQPTGYSAQDGAGLQPPAVQVLNTLSDLRPPRE